MPIGMVNAGLPASVRESFDLIGFDPARHRVQFAGELHPSAAVADRQRLDVGARRCGTGPSEAVWPCWTF
jgi:hypothetical protein